MKIDELIKELEEIREEHGNLELNKLKLLSYNKGPVTGITLFTKEETYYKPV